MSFARFVFATAAITAIPSAAATASATPTFYFGADLGVSLMTQIESTRTNTGVPTNCDQWLEPVTVRGQVLPLPAGQCQPRELPSSGSEFDLDPGLAVGLNVGYAGLGPFRVEAEYLHHRQGGERVSLFVPGDPKQREFSVREEEIRNLRADNAFVNVYYDFPNLGGSALRPYMGAGFGVSWMKIDYSATSVRRGEEVLRALDPPRHPGAANKVSYTSETLSDRFWSSQLIGGMDYTLTDRIVLTGKVRYVRALSDFRDKRNPWRSLRGHASTVAPGGEPIHYGISTSNPEFWTFSIGLKSFF